MRGPRLHDRRLQCNPLPLGFPLSTAILRVKNQIVEVHKWDHGIETLPHGEKAMWEHQPSSLWDKKANSAELLNCKNNGERAASPFEWLPCHSDKYEASRSS